MEVTILGNNSALPAHSRHPTSQYVSLASCAILIDCGEGTQMQLSKFQLKRNRIEYILISHLHGDHFFGLPGLLTSLNHLGRKKPLQVWGPPNLDMLLEQIFAAAEVTFNFPLEVHTFEESASPILIRDDFEIISFPLLHRVPTWGFIISQQQAEWNILVDKIEEHNLSFDQIKLLKTGHDITLTDGSVLSVEQATKPKLPAIKYAYCSDTAYYPSIVPHIKGADLLYHEATFGDEHQKKATKTKHSTAREAARIAKQAKVKKLLLGHYSSRYIDLQFLEDEAQEVFPHSYLSREGSTYSVG